MIGWDVNRRLRLPNSSYSRVSSVISLPLWCLKGRHDDVACSNRLFTSGPLTVLSPVPKLWCHPADMTLGLSQWDLQCVPSEVFGGILAPFSPQRLISSITAQIACFYPVKTVNHKIWEVYNQRERSDVYAWYISVDQLIDLWTVSALLLGYMNNSLRRFKTFWFLFWFGVKAGRGAVFLSCLPSLWEAIRPLHHVHCASSQLLLSPDTVMCALTCFQRSFFWASNSSYKVSASVSLSVSGKRFSPDALELF